MFLFGGKTKGGQYKNYLGLVTIISHSCKVEEHSFGVQALACPFNMDVSRSRMTPG